MKVKKKTSKKKAGKLYSKGQLNYLVDDAFHPLADRTAGFILVDEILHMLIERDPGLSIKKFVHYSLPQFIKKFAEDM
jgi:hypothetical protein